MPSRKKSHKHSKPDTDLHAAAMLLHILATEERVWSIEQWAKKSSVSPSTVHNILKGRTQSPSFDTLQKLGKSVKINIAMIGDTVLLSNA